MNNKNIVVLIFKLQEAEIERLLWKLRNCKNCKDANR